MQNTSAPSAGSLVARRILLGLFMLVPFCLAGFGAWVGSTLAVYLDGPVWLALVGSVVVFMLLPLGWELVADPNQRGGRIRDAILRSSFLSTVLVVVLVATHPETTFKALATRGDWWLAGSKTPAAESLRKLGYVLADGLEWLNDAVRDKPYRESDDSAKVDPGVVTAWQKEATTAPAQKPTAKPSDDGPAVMPGVPIPGTELRWPLEATPHPSLAQLPDDAKKSPQTVGKWLKDNVADPFERAKAVHDFVAFHVDYDYERLRNDSNNATNQAANVVFKTGLGVCAGYANLTRAIGVAAGLNMIVVVGDSRNLFDYKDRKSDDLMFPEDGGHAWNAVELNGQWYLLDTTWDAGHGSIEEGFTRNYKTTYLFIPPEAMLIDHLPDAKKWQLVETPLSRAEWLRQPSLKPTLVAHGITLTDHPAPIVARNDPVIIPFTNPAGFHIGAHLKPADGDAKSTPCEQRSNARSGKFICPPLPGRFSIDLFASPTRYGDSVWLGSYWMEE